MLEKVEKMNALAMIMLMSNPAALEGSKEHKMMYTELIEHIASTESHSVLDVLHKSIPILLRNMKVPEEDVREIQDMIKEKGVRVMFEVLEKHTWPAALERGKEEGILLGIEQGIERGRIEQIRRMYENGYIKRDVVEKELQDLGFFKEKALAERKKWDEEIERERVGGLTM